MNRYQKEEMAILAVGGVVTAFSFTLGDPLEVLAVNLAIWWAMCGGAIGLARFFRWKFKKGEYAKSRDK